MENSSTLGASWMMQSADEATRADSEQFDQWMRSPERDPVEVDQAAMKLFKVIESPNALEIWGADMDVFDQNLRNYAGFVESQGRRPFEYEGQVTMRQNIQRLSQKPQETLSIFNDEEFEKWLDSSGNRELWRTLGEDKGEQKQLKIRLKNIRFMATVLGESEEEISYDYDAKRLLMAGQLGLDSSEEGFLNGAKQWAKKNQSRIDAAEWLLLKATDEAMIGELAEEGSFNDALVELRKHPGYQKEKEHLYVSLWNQRKKEVDRVMGQHQELAKDLLWVMETYRGVGENAGDATPFLSLFSDGRKKWNEKMEDVTAKMVALDEEEWPKVFAIAAARWKKRGVQDSDKGLTERTGESLFRGSEDLLGAAFGLIWQGMDKVTGEDIGRKMNKLRQETNRFERGMIDPSRWEGDHGWFSKGWFANGLIDATYGVPMMLSAATGWGGIALTANHYRDDVAFKFEEAGMDRTTANSVAVPLGVAMSFLDRLQLNVATGKLPVLGNYLKSLTTKTLVQKSLQKGAFVGVALGTETVIEKIQDNVLPDLTQNIIASLDKDVPHIDWKKHFEGYKMKETLGAMLPLAILAGMGDSARNYYGEQQIQSMMSEIKELHKVGISEEHIEAIVLEENTDKKLELLQEAWKSRAKGEGFTDDAAAHIAEGKNNQERSQILSELEAEEQKARAEMSEPQHDFTEEAQRYDAMRRAGVIPEILSLGEGGYQVTFPDANKPLQTDTREAALEAANEWLNTRSSKFSQEASKRIERIANQEVDTVPVPDQVPTLNQREAMNLLSEGEHKVVGEHFNEESGMGFLIDKATLNKVVMQGVKDGEPSGGHRVRIASAYHLPEIINKAITLRVDDDLQDRGDEAVYDLFAPVSWKGQNYRMRIKGVVNEKGRRAHSMRVDEVLVEKSTSDPLFSESEAIGKDHSQGDASPPTATMSVANLFGGVNPYSGKRIKKARTKKSIRQEARMRQASAQERLERDVWERYGYILAQEELAKLKDQPVHSYLSKPNDPLHGRLMSRTEAIRSDRYDPAKHGEYDGAGSASRTLFGGSLMPDQAAQELYGEGLIPDPYPDTMWEALAKEQNSVFSRKEELAKARRELADAKDTAKREADTWLEKELRKQDTQSSPEELRQRASSGYFFDGETYNSPEDQPVSKKLEIESRENYGDPISAPKVIQKLEGVLKSVGSKTPIRVGKLRGRGALGQYWVRQRMIRLKTANDISTAAHEVAHAIEDAIYGESHTWGKVFASKSGEHQELTRMGKALYGNQVPAAGYDGEGFAEFFRMLVEGGYEHVRLHAPKFTEWFEENIASQNPKLSQALEETIDSARRWNEQGAMNRAKQSVVETPSRVKIVADKVRTFMEAVPGRFIDSAWSLKQFVAEAQETSKGGILDSENPYQTLVAKRLSHHGTVNYMVENGMVDFAGNVTGKGLKDAIAPVKGRNEDFILYLWARRTIALHQSDNPRDTGLKPQDAYKILDELDSSEFRLAAQGVYDWNNGVLQYAADASSDFAQVVDKIREVDPGSYIPLFREFDAFAERYKKLGTDAKGGSLVKKLKGSGRRIKNPVESMIGQATAVVLKANQKRILDQIVKIADTVPGLGHLVAEVPKDMIPAASQDMESMLREIGKRVRKAGGTLELDSGDLNLAEEVLTLWTPAHQPTKAGEDPIIPIFKNGERKWYEVDSTVYEAINGMDIYRLPKVLDIFLGIPTRTLRLGTTGLRASFSLVTNPLRDLRTLHLNSAANANAMELFFEWLNQLKGSALNVLSGGTVRSEWIDLFERLGGGMATPLGQDSQPVKRASRRLFESKFHRVIDARNWVDFLRDALQFPEAASRIAEMKKVAKDMGWEPGMELTPEISAKLVTAAKQVTTDFTASGNVARVLNQAIPFFNAGIQGPRAHIRSFKKNPTKFIFRGMQGTALALALWWKYKDEEWWKQMSAKEKYGYTYIPFETEDGKKELLRIPRSFEADGIFMAGAQAFADAWYQEKPEEAAAWFKTFAESFQPSLPPLVEDTLEQASNKDFYFKSPIVPRGQLEVPEEEQFTPYTTRLAIDLGDVTGISPRRIDHSIRSYFGGLGSDVASVFGRGLPGEERDRENELADMPILGTIFNRGGQSARNPKSIEKAYELFDKAIRKSRSNKNPENEEERQLRLQLQDAIKAISYISDVERLAWSVDERRQLKERRIHLAAEAVSDYEEKKINRGKFKRQKKETEREKALLTDQELD